MAIGSERDAAAALPRAARWLLGGAAILPWPILLGVIGNHLVSPDISRGVVYETVRRLMRGLPIYPAPSGEFVALDYNPLLYYLGSLAARLFGLSPASLRFVAVLGTLGVAALIFVAVRRATGSAWFGFLACGLFAGAYRTFDCFFDHQQPDSWMLFAALAGLLLIQDTDRPARLAAGVVLLCVAFWFKQQGALLAIGGILELTRRLGARRAAPYWALAVLLGPLAYFGLGPRLFGPEFLYYTWEVPRSYSQFRLLGILHAGWFFTRYWAIPAILVAYGIASRRLRSRPLDVWTFTLPGALLIGVLGAMDYSEHNVYIAAGVWLIILGAVTLARIMRAAAALPEAVRRRTALVMSAGVAFTFAINAYDPRTVLVPARAWLDYADLIARVRALGGQVYMPGVGQLPGDVDLPIRVHWVPLEDLVRGHGHEGSPDPLVSAILRDVQYPSGEAYIIADRRLDEDTLLAFLGPSYDLVEDLGDRYASLKGQPGWYSGRTWPRYLYRHRATAAPAPG